MPWPCVASVIPKRLVDIYGTVYEFVCVLFVYNSLYDAVSSSDYAVSDNWIIMIYKFERTCN